jgi:hypothetical protein
MVRSVFDWIREQWAQRFRLPDTDIPPTHQNPQQPLEQHTTPTETVFRPVFRDPAPPSACPICNWPHQTKHGNVVRCQNCGSQRTADGISTVVAPAYNRKNWPH